MKKITFLSLLLLTFCILFFSACKKDEELSTKDKLVGKWNYESVKFEEYENEKLVDSGSDSITGATIEFKDNETYVATSTDKDGDVDTSNGTWKLEGNTLKMGEIGDINTMEIKEITGKKMVLLYEEKGIGIEDGINYRYTGETTFKKQ